MTTLLQSYNDFISGGYPVVREKFLLQTPYPMMFIVTFYVLFVKYIGPAIMERRKPLEMRRLIVAYNMGLVIYYTYFITRGAYLAYQFGLSTFCHDKLDFANPIVIEMVGLGYSIYYVRFLELIDTVFLVLTKKFKMITSLHVFHHSIVPVFGWFGFRCERSPYLGVFMGVNSFVHIIMYTYYAIAALGPEYQKYIWWKKYLTSLQISQFVIMTLYLLFMSAVGCVTSKFTVGFCICLSVLFLFLFVDYYRRTFKKTQKKELHENGETSGNGEIKSKSN